MISLFVRSYQKDFKWLDLSIRSMQKFLSGVNEKVLVIPSTDEPTPLAREFFDYIIPSSKYNNVYGYIAQQLDKLEAYKYVANDLILYSDSDCIYTGPFDAVEQLTIDGLPVLFMTNYDLLPPQGGHWREVVHKYININPTYEFMRAFPLIHRTQTVRALIKDYPDLLKRASTITNTVFSEFNMIGAYAYEHQHPYVYTEQVQPIPCKQYWSYSNLTPEEQREINAILSE
jgi:hypothetical protein